MMSERKRLLLRGRVKMTHRADEVRGLLMQYLNERCSDNDMEHLRFELERGDGCEQETVIRMLATWALDTLILEAEPPSP